MSAFGYVPDWPVVGAVSAIVAVVSGIVAAIYARRSALASERALEIQTIQHRATARAYELTDDQLIVLRHASKGWRSTSVPLGPARALRFVRTYVLPGNVKLDPEHEDNRGFFESVPFLEENGLIDVNGITADGRELLRINSHRTPDRKPLKSDYRWRSFK